MRRILLTLFFANCFFIVTGQNPIPLEEIDTSPAFRKCKEMTGDELRECFYREITLHVQQNLVYPPDAILERLESRVYASFVIDEKGRINNVMARGEHPSLEEEAIRLILELPRFSPGVHHGQKTSTSVTLPILFRMPPSQNSSKTAYRPEQFNDSVATTLERVPIFPGCENLPNEEARKCFNKKLQEHIRDNFRYPRMAQIKNIQGTVYANFVINTDGSLGDINLVAPHQLLADETLRIIGLLPKLTPGIQNGRSVRVPYSFPISFRLLSPR